MDTLQRKRLIKRITEEGFVPKKSTLVKYHLEIKDDELHILEPEKPRVPISLDDALSHLSAGTAKAVADKTKGFGKWWRKNGFDDKDIIPVLENPEKLKELLLKDFPNANTRGSYYKPLIKLVSPLEGLPFAPVKPETRERYKALFTEMTHQKPAEETTHNWFDILEKGKDNLFVRLYDEVPVRGEFISHKIPIRTEDTPEGNYILEKDDKVSMVIQDFKTKGGNYPDRNEYEFSPELKELYHKHKGKTHLFERLPDVLGIMKDIGFPTFPFGREETDRRNIVSGLRRTIISSRNAKEGHGRPSGAQLARLMLHDPSTAERVYFGQTKTETTP